MYIEQGNMSEHNWKVNVGEVERGLDLLFNPPISREMKAAFIDLAKESYGRQHCIAWWYYARENESSSFTELCKSFDICPDRREIIITEENRLMFSPDYHSRPQMV